MAPTQPGGLADGSRVRLLALAFSSVGPSSGLLGYAFHTSPQSYRVPRSSWLLAESPPSEGWLVLPPATVHNPLTTVAALGSGTGATRAPPARTGVRGPEENSKGDAWVAAGHMEEDQDPLCIHPCPSLGPPFTSLLPWGPHRMRSRIQEQGSSWGATVSEKRELQLGPGLGGRSGQSGSLWPSLPVCLCPLS